MVFVRHPEIRVFHLSTDKSTGKDYLSGATNVRLGQHRQLISPPLNTVLLLLLHCHNRFPTFSSYLHVSGDSFGRPISGQREVSGYPSPSELNYWQAQEGIFVTPSEDPAGTYRPEAPDVHQNAHTEL